MTLRYDTRSRVSTYTQSWVSNADPDFGAFESIATTVITSDTASVTFSSIPQTYKHLQLRMHAKTDRADLEDVTLVQFNGDTASNYSYHNIRGNGTATVSEGASSTSYIYLHFASTGSTGVTNIFASSVVDILDYADTNKFKTTRSLHGFDANGSGRVYLVSGNWRSTSAITSIVLDQQYGTNWKQYSHFALYGIKA